jgi:hypothetical protein
MREKLFGPYQEVRDAVYDEIDKLVNGSERRTVRELLYSAVEAVRLQVEEARARGEQHLIKGLERGYPWSNLRAFLTILFTRRPVLRNGDALVTASWRDRGLEVDGADQNWRTMLDAELIVFLLENQCVIDAYSEDDLAGALFNSRRPDAVRRVQDCISHLIESNRCEVLGDRLQLVLKRIS